MRNLILALIGLTVLGATVRAGNVRPGGVSSVAVLTENPEAENEAIKILVKNGWGQVSLHEARYVLVVVQTIDFDPLHSFYDSPPKSGDENLIDEDSGKDGLSQLKEAVHHEDSLAGDQFAVYLYRVDPDKNVSEIQRAQFPARTP
jgi:hypothetical protein